MYHEFYPRMTRIPISNFSRHHEILKNLIFTKNHKSKRLMGETFSEMNSEDAMDRFDTYIDSSLYMKVLLLSPLAYPK